MLYHDDFGAPGDLRQASWLRLLYSILYRADRERSAHRTNSLALPWIKKYVSEDPYFLWIHYFDPHAPYVPDDLEYQYYKSADLNTIPHTEEAHYQKAKAALGFRSNLLKNGLPEALYLGEVSTVDRAVGNVLREFDERNQTANLNVVIVSDHGESFGEHGLFYTHGEDIFEPALAIPMCIMGPGFPKGKLDDRLTSIADIPPTLLHAMRLPAGNNMEGYNLTDKHSERHYALVENFGIIMAESAEKQRGVRSETWKYFWSGSQDKRHLFNLVNDPGEMLNLKDTVNDLADELNRLTGEGFNMAGERQKPVQIDISTDTKEKLNALGYLF